MSYLELRNVDKSFAGIPAVRDLTLAVDQGAFVSLLGPSGCGKTTTLRMLAGFLLPDKGEIALQGTTLSGPSVTVPPERRRMGMVFQTYALWPHMTIGENVRFGLDRLGVRRSEAARRVDAMLELVGLGQTARRYPHELSGGQQQRVALARALVTEPAILLLDEPLSNLDAKLREQMRGEIKSLRAKTGVTFIYVTHDQTEALALSDRIAVMQGGRLAQYGTPREIYDRPASLYVADFVGAANKLTGRVSGNAGRVRLDGLDVEIDATTVEGSPGVGEPAVVIIRPEAIKVCATLPENCQSLPGTVVEATFLGGAVDYRIAVGGFHLRAIASRDVEVPVGSEVRLGIPVQHAIVLRPEHDGSRLPGGHTEVAASSAVGSP